MEKSCFHGDDDAVESSEAQINMLTDLKRPNRTVYEDAWKALIFFEGSGTICFLNVKSFRRCPAHI